MKLSASEPIPAEGGVLERAALNAWLELVGGDAGFLAEQIDTLLVEAPALVAGMQSAAVSGDGPALRRAAQTLTSNCRTFGALLLGELCGEIEELAAAARVNGGAALARRLAPADLMVDAALRIERGAS